MAGRILARSIPGPREPIHTSSQKNMIAELRSAIREQTDGRFEVLGEIASDPGGGAVYLARGTWDGSLAILSASQTPSGPYSIEVRTELDDTLVTLGAVCVVCGTASTDRSPNCHVCGTRMEFDDVDPMPHMPPEDVLRAVRQAAGEDFDVIGAIPRPGGRGSLFFARELATSRVVTLTVRRERDDAGKTYLSLGITQLLKVPDERQDGSEREAYRPVPLPAASMKMCPQCSNTYPATIRVCPEDGATLLFAAAEKSLVGRTVGDRYQLVDEIGSGTSGKVYLAEDVREDRRCAVKVIDPTFRGDSDTVERFLGEVSAARRISHANVAQVLDFGESAEGLWVAMEYVEGETLAEILSREAPLPVWRAVDIGRQIANALAAAHSHGILHRDINPRNVIVTTTPEADIVHLVDFGIAWAIQGDSEDSSRPGYVIGTLEFQSPEQLMGSALDGRTDVYSLGCVLFEMLTGQRAFGGPDGPLSIGRRMTEDAPRVRSLNREIPEVIDEILAMALSRDPTKRFQSAASLRDALAQGINGAEVEGVTVGGGWEVSEVETAPASAINQQTGAEAADTSRPFAPSVTDQPAVEPAVPASAPPRRGRTSRGTPPRRRRRPYLSIVATVSAAAVVGFFTISSGKVSLEGRLSPGTAAGVQEDLPAIGGETADPARDEPAAADGPAGAVNDAAIEGAAASDVATPDARTPVTANTITATSGAVGETAATPRPANSETPGAASAATPVVSATPATLFVGGTLPVGAVITVDGVVQTGRSLVLTPGPHILSVAANGHLSADTILQATSGQVLSWSPSLVSLGAGSTGTAQGVVTNPAVTAGAAPAEASSATIPTPSPVEPLGVPATSASAESSSPRANMPAPVTASATPVSALGANATPQEHVNDALARLARALESRDVNQVAAVYAGITEQERAAWTDFFAASTSVRVRISDIAAVPESADIAQPTFTMTIDFANDSGAREPWVQRNRATFVRGPNGWRIEAIREAQ